MTSLAKAVGPLDGRGNLPLYQELQRALRKAIDSRILGPDDALPSERDLAADFAVSRITVRKAIDGLVADGLLVRRQGSGNFVSARVDKNFAKLTSFSEDMRARGRTPRSVWMRRAVGTVTPEEALELRMSPGTPVFRFARIRYADDAPMALEYATIVGIGAAVARRGGYLAVRSPGAGGPTPGARAAAIACRPVDRGSGGVVEGANRGRRTARRTIGFAARWKSHRILAILLSRRYVRFRR